MVASAISGCTELDRALALRLSAFGYCTARAHQLKFATYARRMIAAARLEPPKVISGGEAPARTTSRRGLFSWAASSKRKKAPHVTSGAG